MAIDPISREIIRLVRSLPDEALLALVATHLGKVSGGVRVSRAVVTAARSRAVASDGSRKSGRKPTRKVTKAKPASKRGPKRVTRSSAGRQELIAAVERAIKASNGLSASEIAKAAGVPQARVTSALKELKLAKRIFQGGDRRFARYAGTASVAESASVTARETALGPVLKKKKKTS